MSQIESSAASKKKKGLSFKKQSVKTLESSGKIDHHAALK